MATQYYYGKDRAGNPVYESSTPKSAASSAPKSGGGAVVAAPYSTSAGQSQAITTNAPSVIASGYNSPTAISAAQLAPVAPINIPAPATPVDFGGAAASALAVPPYNSTNADGSVNKFDPNTGKALKDPAVADYGSIAALLQQSLSDVQPVDSAAIYAEQERQNGIQQKQQEVANYSQQLGAIQAKQQTDLLSTRGTAGANGVTEAVYGGIAAQINREAAIASLPVAAALAGAQNNLQLAQQHVETMSKLLINDATSKHDQQIAVINAVIPFLTKQEEARADAIKTQRAQDFSLLTNNINFAQDLAKTAFANGQSQVGASIMKLMGNPSSPTFQSDVAALAGQIAPKASGGTSDWTLFNQADGTTVQYNQRTGEIRPATVGGAAAQVDPVKLQKSQDQLNLLATSLEDAKKKANFSGQSGFVKNGIGFFTGPGNYGDLEAYTNTIRTNVLTLATDPAIKKFFGPQMSNNDVALMTSAGTPLNSESMSPEAYKKELKRLVDFTERAKMSLQGATSYGLTANGTRVGFFPDGTIQDANGKRYDANGDPI